MEEARDAEPPPAAPTLDHDVPVKCSFHLTALTAMTRLGRKQGRKTAVHSIQLERRWAKMKSLRADNIFLTNAKRRTLWVSVLLLQLSNATLLGTTAYFYLGYNRRDSYLWFLQNYFLFSKSVEFLQDYSRWVALLCFAVSAVFVYWSLEMVWHSLRHCQFRFAGPQFEANKEDQLNAKQLRFAMRPQWWDLCLRASQCVPQRCRAWISHYYDVISSLRKAVGIEGPYFDLRMVTNIVVEIASQSYSAYRSSNKISNVFVNPTYGTLIFCNCLTSPLFQWWFKHDLAMRRFAWVLADLLLVFVWGTILPLWLTLPSVRIFLHQELLAAALENPENTTREVEHVLIVSFQNLVFNMVPFLGSILNLAELKTVLTTTDQARSTRIHKQSTIGVEARNTIAMKCRSGWQRQLTAQVDGSSQGSARINNFLSVWYVLATCYGIGILGVSIHSTLTARDSAGGQIVCIHAVFPWFSSKSACIGRRIDCSELGIAGKKAELAAILETFEESSLANLHFMSCSSLEIPSAIPNFPNLLTLVLHNSTLIEWNQDSAVDENSPLQTVRLLDIDLQTFPVGLVGNALSPKLEWIELRNTNATGFIDSIRDSWRHLKYFDCDGCNLTKVPDMVQTMTKLLTLALRDNQITEIPEGAVSDPSATLYGIYLDGNPLTSLPQQIWDLTAQCSDFSIQRTSIAVPAEYLVKRIAKDAVIYGFDTPLCSSSSFASEFTQLNCSEAPY
ncbi:hypothetical protein Gpo141_00005963 [Globisporangium polare]